MPEWKKICCPVDFSEPSRLAMDQSAELARRYEAELTLIHVYDPSKAASTSFIPVEQVTRDVRDLQGKLETWRREAEFLAGRPVAAKTLTGDPAGVILRFARDDSCELIVMGTHGRGGLERLVLGSVAERVVRQADCPVLVTRRIGSLRPD
jgi:nucleotide-binding universal stress UspA family protein